MGLFIGCGPAMTDVNGTVTYQGKPVAFGTVTVFDAEGVAKYGTLNLDGTFTITGVRPGPVKVAVSSPTPPGAIAAKPIIKSPDALDGLDGRKPADANAPANAAVIAAWFPLPEHFGEPTTSGLTADIVAGQPLILQLK